MDAIISSTKIDLGGNEIFTPQFKPLNSLSLIFNG